MEVEGAERVDAALSGTDLDLVEALAESRQAGTAGARLRDDVRLRVFLAPGSLFHALAESRLGPGARPVRCVLFDKCLQTNWALGWHQDRAIAVREKFDVPDFGPWTVKSGIVHVEPPFSYIAGMITLRAFLDPCGVDNGPLLIAPGSHTLGRLPVNQIEDVVRRCGQVACLAARGDVWICATSIVHASAPSRSSTRRRLLMVDYSSAELPLEWAGI